MWGDSVNVDLSRKEKVKRKKVATHLGMILFASSAVTGHRFAI